MNIHEDFFTNWFYLILLIRALTYNISCAGPFVVHRNQENLSKAAHIHVYKSGFVWFQNIPD